MSDLIDRQALKAAHGLGTDCGNCKQSARSCQYDRDFSRMDFCEWIDDAPTIDAVPVVHGEWITTEETEWDIYPFKKKTCSVCDCKIDHTFMLGCMDYFDDRGTVFHYCPNCGARMDGGKNDRS